MNGRVTEPGQDSGATKRLRIGQSIWHHQYSYVCLYLLAVVLANLVVNQWGAKVVVINAFFLIGFDLTSRDRLHDAWHGRGLWIKMFGLITAGSLITYIINRNAAQIAIASLVAFAASGVVDVAIYQRLIKQRWAIRVNGSNILSAAVDSVVFPTLAFGAILPLVIIGQFAAKVLGGYVWSRLIKGTEG